MFEYSGISTKWTHYKADASMRRIVWRGTDCFSLLSNYLRKNLYKADISIKQTHFCAPMMSASQRFHCTSNIYRLFRNSNIFMNPVLRAVEKGGLQGSSKRANLKTEVTRKQSSTPNSWKNKYFLSPDTHACGRVSEGKKICFSEKLTCFVIKINNMFKNSHYLFSYT